MDSLLEMNDFAAFLVECRDYRKALDILNYCLTRTPKEKQATIDTAIMKRAKASLDNSLHKRFSNKGTEGKNIYDCSNNTEAGFVYRNPLRLTERDLARPHVDAEMAMSSNLIFNIALCHHLIALDCQDTNQKHSIKRLKGALKLYELGFHMHSKKGVEGMSMNYALALINNCANIYETLGSTTKAQRFYNHMLSSLMMMIDGGEAEKVDQLEGYLLNASKILLKENVAAAA
ncbi:MAG: hypothetical protein SGARI_005493 [Bacillariaceae sp.]